MATTREQEAYSECISWGFDDPTCKQYVVDMQAFWNESPNTTTNKKEPSTPKEKEAEKKANYWFWVAVALFIALLLVIFYMIYQ